MSWQKHWRREEDSRKKISVWCLRDKSVHKKPSFPIRHLAQRDSCSKSFISVCVRFLTGRKKNRNMQRETAWWKSDASQRKTLVDFFCRCPVFTIHWTVASQPVKSYLKLPWLCRLVLTRNIDTVKWWNTQGVKTVKWIRDQHLYVSLR